MKMVDKKRLLQLLKQYRLNILTEDKYAKSKDIQVKVYNTFKKQPEYKQDYFIQNPGYYDITVTIKDKMHYLLVSSIIKYGGPINSWFKRNKKLFKHVIDNDVITSGSLKKQYPTITFKMLSGSGDQTLQQLYADELLKYFTSLL